MTFEHDVGEISCLGLAAAEKHRNLFRSRKYLIPCKLYSRRMVANRNPFRRLHFNHNLYFPILCHEYMRKNPRNVKNWPSPDVKIFLWFPLISQYYKKYWNLTGAMIWCLCTTIGHAFYFLRVCVYHPFYVYVLTFQPTSECFLAGLCPCFILLLKDFDDLRGNPKIKWMNKNDARSWCGKSKWAQIIPCVKELLDRRVLFDS